MGLPCRTCDPPSIARRPQEAWGSILCQTKKTSTFGKVQNRPVGVTPAGWRFDDLRHRLKFVRGLQHSQYERKGIPVLVLNSAQDDPELDSKPGTAKWRKQSNPAGRRRTVHGGNKKTRRSIPETT